MGRSETGAAPEQVPGGGQEAGWQAGSPFIRQRRSSTRLHREGVEEEARGWRNEDRKSDRGIPRRPNESEALERRDTALSLCRDHKRANAVPDRSVSVGAGVARTRGGAIRGLATRDQECPRGTARVGREATNPAQGPGAAGRRRTTKQGQGAAQDRRGEADGRAGNQATRSSRARDRHDALHGDPSR